MTLDFAIRFMREYFGVSHFDVLFIDQMYEAWPLAKAYFWESEYS